MERLMRGLDPQALNRYKSSPCPVLPIGAESLTVILHGERLTGTENGLAAAFPGGPNAA